jgi:aspartate-semialdehyde dehydrogenase
MVSRFGEESSASLTSVQQRVLKHYRKIVEGRAPAPSVMVLQAPVFHGYSFSLSAQFEKPADVQEISRLLAGDHVSVIKAPEEAPSNVSAAGQGGILVSVTPDETDDHSAWIWATSDNLRVAALTAVECAEDMAASRPRGQIQ